MATEIPELDDRASRVFTEISMHRAMPLLEIAAVTGIRGSELQETLNDLAAKELITVKGPENPIYKIVSVKYF